MKADTGDVLPLSDLEGLFASGKEKPEDWDDVSDLSEEEISRLRQPMNRHDRRAAIKLARLQRRLNEAMK